MGDRFYIDQQKPTPRAKIKTSTGTRVKLKKDYISEINGYLRRDMVGLDKCTIATLQQLIDGIKECKLL